MDAEMIFDWTPNSPKSVAVSKLDPRPTSTNEVGSVIAEPMSVPSGLYVYKFEAGDFVASRKMLLVR